MARSTEQMSPEDARALVKPSETEDELLGYDPEDNIDDSDGLWDDAETAMEEDGKTLHGDAPEGEEEPSEEDVAERANDWQAMADELRRENEELRQAQEATKTKEFQKYLESLEPEERLKAELAHERDLRKQSELRAVMSELQAESPKASAAYSIFSKHFDLEVEDPAALRKVAAEMEKEFEAIFGAMGQRVEQKVMKSVKQAWGVDTGLHRQKSKAPNVAAPDEQRLKEIRAQIKDPNVRREDAVERLLRERRRQGLAS